MPNYAMPPLVSKSEASFIQTNPYWSSLMPILAFCSQYGSDVLKGFRHWKILSEQWATGEFWTSVTLVPRCHSATVQQDRCIDKCLIRHPLVCGIGGWRCCFANTVFERTNLFSACEWFAKMPNDSDLWKLLAFISSGSQSCSWLCSQRRIFQGTIGDLSVLGQFRCLQLLLSASWNRPIIKRAVGIRVPHSGGERYVENIWIWIKFCNTCMLRYLNAFTNLGRSFDEVTGNVARAAWPISCIFFTVLNKTERVGRGNQDWHETCARSMATDPCTILETKHVFLTRNCN